MTGIKHEKAVCNRVCDVFRFSDNNISFRLLLGDSVEEARKGSTVTKTSSLVTRYGNTVPITITSSPIIDKNGAVKGIVNLVRDISREKELDRMKTEIVRSVSHEFRTPLSAIVGMTEMLLSGDVEETKVEKYLTIIRNEGLRLSRMVTELLNIARIESGKESIKLTSFGLSELFTRVGETIAPLADKKNASIRFDAGEIGAIVADIEKMEELLINFIDNSLTYSDEGCRIEIHAVRNNDMLSITVSDNGWGIPEEDMTHIGERFYRGRNAEKIKGTGLGLALCSELLKMHDGSMNIQSRAGEGTRITMSIPYREVV
jgi:signal transduction histidine kinase